MQNPYMERLTDTATLSYSPTSSIQLMTTKKSITTIKPKTATPLQTSKQINSTKSTGNVNKSFADSPYFELKIFAICFAIIILILGCAYYRRRHQWRKGDIDDGLGSAPNREMHVHKRQTIIVQALRNLALSKKVNKLDNEGLSNGISLKHNQDAEKSFWHVDD